MKLSVMALAALTLLPGTGLAGHQVAWPDGSTGDVVAYPFEIIPEFTVTTDWVGIGGPGGEDTHLEVVFLPDGTPFLCCTPSDTLGVTSPVPDDCADLDGWLPAAYTKAPFPSIALRPSTGEGGTLVPEQSVPAGIVADLCSLVREAAVGQESGYQYATDPQRVGVGDVSLDSRNRIGTVGSFDTAFQALPASLEAAFCGPSELAGTSAAGDEEWASAGLPFPNGVLEGQPARDCLNIAGAYLEALATLPDAQWDAGSINLFNNGSVYLLPMDGQPSGLYILCLAAVVFDLNNAVAGVFEDYAYFWYDQPPYLLASSWLDPANTDSVAGDQDCSTIGIPV